MYAAKIGYIDTVKAILASNYCTSEILSAKDQNGYNALMLAEINSHTNIVKAIMASNYCTPAIVSGFINVKLSNTLITAVSAGKSDLVKDTLTNHHCTSELLSTTLSAKDQDGNNVLMIAAKKGHTNISTILKVSLYL